MTVKHEGRKRNINAHKFSFEAFVGPVPRGHVVRHRCHNRRCVNPDHLMVGTQRDNIHDAMERGTLKHWSAPAGEANHCAKLATEDVLRIRSDPRSNAAIAREYGVSHTTISGIKRRTTWRHLT